MMLSFYILAYPVQGPFVFLLPKTIASFGFELYLLKGITETSRVHEIWNLRFYYIRMMSEKSVHSNILKDNLLNQGWN